MAGNPQRVKKETFEQEFERVPPCYKEAEKVLRKVKTCQGNYKTMMSNSRLQGALYKKVYSLVVNVLENWPLLEKIIEDTDLLTLIPFLRKDFAAMLVYEIIFGKGLPGQSRPVIEIRQHETEIRKAYNVAKKDVKLPFVSIPRYARVNTIATSVFAVIGDLKNYGFQQILYDKNTSLDGYMNLVKSLQVGYFLVDFHFKDLLVFASKENLPRMNLHRNGHIFIQDKSSYIPVHALNPKPGSMVLDACAAPGMKTLHIAAAMGNEGKIYAYEQDKTRFDSLISNLSFGNVTICEADWDDFYLVNISNPKFHSLEYILVDPSCSGSGMVNRMDSVTDTEHSKTEERLKKLSGFQIMLLKHALRFPSVKRVVYSTCSINEMENEYVVHEALNKYGHIFKLVSVMPDWPIRGSDKFEYGPLCLRANPDESLTNGFFVAMFERLDDGSNPNYTPLYDNFGTSTKWPKKNKNRKLLDSESMEVSNIRKSKGEFTEFFEEAHSYNENCNDQVPEDANLKSSGSDLFESVNKKKHKKKHRSKDQESELTVELDNVIDTIMEVKVENDMMDKPAKKKSHKDKKNRGVDCEQQSTVVDFNEIKMEVDAAESFIKIKHKKRKHKSEDKECLPVEDSLKHVENDLECHLAKKKHKKTHKSEDECLPIENSLEHAENAVQCRTSKEHKKRHYSEDQETIFKDNTFRAKMDEDIDQEKHLNENVENCTVSMKKKRKIVYTVAKEITETEIVCKKSKSTISTDYEAFEENEVSETICIDSEPILENQIFNDSLIKKKHKKKCKTKKNRVE